jgi:hypothetical protein
VGVRMGPPVRPHCSSLCGGPLGRPAATWCLCLASHNGFSQSSQSACSPVKHICASSSCLQNFHPPFLNLRCAIFLDAGLHVIIIPCHAPGLVHWSLSEKALLPLLLVEDPPTVPSVVSVFCCDPSPCFLLCLTLLTT